MPGLYIHVPFCAQKCTYCDFYSIVPQARKQEFVDALIKEIELRQSFFEEQQISSIFFGGGTPSLLSLDQFQKIFSQISACFFIKNDAEITIEANPEDLSDSYIKGLLNLGINRLSIGVQSFIDDDLIALKRSHNSKIAKDAILRAYRLGFHNISVDLIYGLPFWKKNEWSYNLDQITQLPIQHLSAYHLSFEKGTLLHKQREQNKVQETSEALSDLQFKQLLSFAKDQGFEAYEISNFAKNKMYSKHNLSYWHRDSYLGLGPSAHSYNAKSRFWNVSNVKQYIESLNVNSLAFEEEKLTEIDMRNEVLITNLRTRWGISLDDYKDEFGVNALENLLQKAEPLINKGLVLNTKHLKLSEEGVFISDYIMRRLFN
ncbi:MAG: radical SAM family heme chaperone HemW [Bacteroidales bacterium]|nr:radical SAM family heme chaperone HemW [Bacteroidales bacterium]